MRDRQGFILVYDITNPASVDDLQEIYQQILRNKMMAVTSSLYSSESAVPLVLVGNKLDLAIERKVSDQRGKEVASQWRCPHYEASAKTRRNVDEIFYDLVMQMMAIREEELKGKNGGTLGEGRLQEKDDVDDDSVRTGCCTIS